MKTYRLAAQQCPSCGTTLNAASVMQGASRPPRPGDLTLCIRCAAVLEYRDDLQLRTAPDEALDELPTEDRAALDRARRLVLEARS